MPTTPLSNAYTNSPELQPNWFLRHFQLLLWLFFHPSAWRNYVKRIDANLEPDFCLLELNTAQLLKIQWLLINFLIWPIVASSAGVVGLSLLDSNYMRQSAWFLGIGYGVIGGLVVGLIISVAMGLVYGTVLALFVFLLPDVGHISSGIAFYAAAGGVASHILLNITVLKPVSQLKNQSGAILPSIILSLMMIALSYGIVSGKLLGLSSPGRIGASNKLFDSIMYGSQAGGLYWTLLSIAIWLRTKKLHLSSIFGGIGGMLMAIGYGGSTFAPYKGGLFIELTTGIAGGLLFSIFYVWSYVIAEYVGGKRTAVISGTLVSGLFWAPLKDYIFNFEFDTSYSLLISLLVMLPTLTLTWWMSVLIIYPLSLAFGVVLYQFDKQRFNQQYHLLRFHPVFWNEHQYKWFKLFGLDSHLVLVVEHNPDKGQQALNYVSLTPQWWAAQAAQIELDARLLKRCTDISTIAQAHHHLSNNDLTSEANNILRTFPRISHEVEASLNQVTFYAQRTRFESVRESLANFQRELTRSDEPYAPQFMPIVEQWLYIVKQQIITLTQTIEQTQEIISPYIPFPPLQEGQEIFTGRIEISQRIQELFNTHNRPSLLLYGQRRMGKTSLLRNLGHLLPKSIIPLFLDGQRLASAENYPKFMHEIAVVMQRSAKTQHNLILPVLPFENLAHYPLTGFNTWLDQLEDMLDTQQVFLLEIDELEAIDNVFDKRLEAKDVLTLFRHLIQHRPKFKVLLASSHTLTELDRWASYFINLEVVKISYLTQQETYQLVEKPVKNFMLRYEPLAIQRIWNLTRGHPALVQLLCDKIIQCKNRQEPTIRRLAQFEDVEIAIPQALSSGTEYFANIEREIRDYKIEYGIAILCFLATKGEQGKVSLLELVNQFNCSEKVLQVALSFLLQRDLVELVDENYRFQVELIRRWFVRSKI